MAKLFRIVNLAENAGYGFDKMDEGWKPYGGAVPVFEQGVNYTKAEFWLPSAGGQTGGQTGGQIGGQIELLTSRPSLITIYQFDEAGIHEASYEETEHFELTKSFLNNPSLYLRHLFNS